MSNDDMSLRPRPGETPQDTVDRVIEAVKAPSLAEGRILYELHRDDKQTLTVEVREQESNRLVGYVEITLTRKGAAITGTNGADDSDADGEIILLAEAPS